MEPGASLGRFKIVEPIGTGGMGVVYKATDPELGRTVAIKVLHDEAGSEGNEARLRLLREAKAMAQLAHPNVVPVHEIGSGEPSFIVMEHVAGGTLRQWLAEPRSILEIIGVFEQAGRGLAAAHDAGLVHRDFKPENCLRGTDGRVRVVDFGLVANRAERSLELPSDTSLDVALTRTGIAMGTPAYMAPEQHRGEPSDARSDQFSFAVTLYEALYGERPFAGTTYREMARNVYAGTIRSAPPETTVPESLRAVLLRALSVDPAGRYASLSDMLVELKPVDPAVTPPVGTLVVPMQLAQATPVVAAPSARRKSPIAIAAVAIVVAVGAGIVAASSSSSSSSSSTPSLSSPPTSSTPSATSQPPASTSPTPAASSRPTPPSSTITPTKPADDPKATTATKIRPPVVRTGSAASPSGSATPPVEIDDAADRRRRQLELKE